MIVLVLIAAFVHGFCCMCSKTFREKRMGRFMAPLPEADEEGIVTIDPAYELRILVHSKENTWQLYICEAEDMSAVVWLAWLTYQALAYFIIGEVQPLDGYTAVRYWYDVIRLVLCALIFLVMSLLTLDLAK